MNLILSALNKGYKPEDLKTPDGYDKHVHCEGSREHVLYYTDRGVHCTHKNCVVNHDNMVNVSEWIFLN